MTTLTESIKQAKQSMVKDDKGQIYTVTVRIPEKLHSIISDLGYYLNISRQELLLQLMQHGVDFAIEQIEESDNEENYIDTSNNANNYFILNTNKKHSLSSTKSMLDNHTAEAYYGNWKNKIHRIKKDDIVFLYENAVGIIAFGKGSGEVLKKDIDGDKDECFYQKLKDFTILKEPIKASTVNEILDRKIIFLGTLSKVPDGQKILDIIK